MEESRNSHERLCGSRRNSSLPRPSPRVVPPLRAFQSTTKEKTTESKHSPIGKLFCVIVDGVDVHTHRYRKLAVGRAFSEPYCDLTLLRRKVEIIHRAGRPDQHWFVSWILQTLRIQVGCIAVAKTAIGANHRFSGL